MKAFWMEAAKKRGRGRPATHGKFKNQGLKYKGRPKGVPSYDAEELANRRIDLGMISRYYTLNSHLTEEQLKQRQKEKNISILEKKVINSLLRDDDSGFQLILDRMIGKVPLKLISDLPKQYADMTPEQLLEEQKRLDEINRKTVERIEKYQAQRLALQQGQKEQLGPASEQPPIDIEAKEIIS